MDASESRLKPLYSDPNSVTLLGWQGHEQVTNLNMTGSLLQYLVQIGDMHMDMKVH